MSEEEFIDPYTFQTRMARGGKELSMRTILRWCNNGKLDARQIARRWCIRPREVARILEAGSESEVNFQ